MKQFSLFLLLSFFYIIQTNNQYASSENQPLKLDIQIHNNTSNNSSGGASQATATQENDQATITAQSNEQEVSTTQRLYQKLHSFYDEFKKHFPDNIDYLWDKKYKILAISACIGYLYLCYHLQSAHAIIKDSHSWCNWKQIISTQHLVSTPYQELIPQLLTDIQKKYYLKNYTNYKKESSISIPLEQFVQDLQHELYTLKQYLHIQRLIKKCYASLFFSFLYSEKIICEKISRTQIVLDIFITWQTQDLLKKNIAEKL